MTKDKKTAQDYAKTHEASDDVLAAPEAHGKPAAAPWEADRDAGKQHKGGKIRPLLDKKDPK